MTMANIIDDPKADANGAGGVLAGGGTNGAGANGVTGSANGAVTNGTAGAASSNEKRSRGASDASAGENTNA